MTDVKERAVSKSLRYSVPPYCVGLLDHGWPIVSLPGDTYEMLERGFAPTAEEVRRQLIQLRRDLRWSRSMLAAFLGVSRSVLRRWETGDRRPSGAARRLIWLLALLAREPEKLTSAIDMVFWGKGEECSRVPQVSLSA